jgi:predicted TIM-barrel fold metal-dependent hydrolase
LVIDAHTHLLPPGFRDRLAELRRRDATFATLFPTDDARLATADDLVAAMERDGVQTSVAVGYGWCDPAVAREANDYLLASAEAHTGRIVPFVSVHPGWGDAALAEVERSAAAGARGIGEFHLASQRIDLPHGDGMPELMALAARLGLPVLVHGSEPVGHAYPGKGDTTPDKLMALAQAYPGTTFIFAHWGGGLPFYALMPEVWAALTNVYFDSAASPFLYGADVFAAVTGVVGADRVLFGSDFPLLSARRSADQARTVLPQDDAAAVLHGNAARLFGL